VQRPWTPSEGSVFLWSSSPIMRSFIVCGFWSLCCFSLPPPFPLLPFLSFPSDALNTSPRRFERPAIIVFPDLLPLLICRVISPPPLSTPPRLVFTGCLTDRPYSPPPPGSRRRDLLIVTSKVSGEKLGLSFLRFRCSSSHQVVDTFLRAALDSSARLLLIFGPPHFCTTCLIFPPHARSRSS